MSIVRKMRLKEGPLYLLKAPEDCVGYFEGLEHKHTLAGKQEIEQVILFAQNKAVPDDMMPKLAPRLAHDALVWIAYPKKTGKIVSDMSRDHGWEAVFAAGYEPVTQVAVDDNWSALRFRKTELIGPKLRDISMGDRQVEGVDFVNRKVIFPADLKTALKDRKDLLQILEGMSFSHQKEYVQAIVTSKKPETRTRRIEKTIELLEKYKADKAGKK